MADYVAWAQPNGFLPSGLLPNEVAAVTRVLDEERWAKAEERTAELIARIQPNKPSEERRNAVADYVQRLIAKCFSCQVFTFGSVPLKTYLPDGDIDLTVFSKNENLKETWANQVRDMLENEEHSENAEFRVKEVQYIQADVKIIKCLVENIVVDISFNQLGGLCTLCFLEEVDHLINQSHLFKRSIILIKAWCYYESRLLGAHHGLISTYALETLVLYIFHVFNNSFAGPLEVLYRFLEFFSNFDWENFCVSLWGPVPISSLPDMTAEPPRKDSRELLLSKLFLDACSSVYAVLPGSQENQGLPFVSKHFNIIDPLRTNNNLGRSVSKGNFFRIRSAFSFGAKRLARLLDCSKENLVAEVNLFFMNTWDRHGSGRRPDAASFNGWCLRPLNLAHLNGSEKQKDDTSIKKRIGSREAEIEGTCSTHGISVQHHNHPSEIKSRTSNGPSTSQNPSQGNLGYQSRSRTSNQFAGNIESSDVLHAEKGQRSSRPDNLMDEVQRRFQFARTRSSPELTNTSNDVPRVRHNRMLETGKRQLPSSRPDYNRRKNSVTLDARSGRSGTAYESSLRHNPSRRGVDTHSSNLGSNNYDEAGFGAFGEDLESATNVSEMNQEEQDLVNMTASSRLHGLSGEAQMPKNLSPHYQPVRISPSVLASLGYAQRNLMGMIPPNIPMVERSWSSNMVSSPLSHHFPSVGLVSNEGMVESDSDNADLTEVKNVDRDHSFWHDQFASSSDATSGGFQVLQSDDKQQSTSVGYNYVPLPQVSSCDGSFMRGHKYPNESRDLVNEESLDKFQSRHERGNEVFSSNRDASLRSLLHSQPISSRSKASSESSCDGSSVKVSKSARDKQGRKTMPSADLSTVYAKVKSGWLYESTSVDAGSSQADDDENRIPLSTMNNKMGEGKTGFTSMVSSHVQNHKVPNCETTQMNGSDSMIPIAPMPLDSGLPQRQLDNSGVVPYAFYLTGPPVPFLTMLPVYNFPPERGNSEGSTNNLDKEERLNNGHINQTGQNFESTKNHEQSEGFSTNSNTGVGNMDAPEDYKSDILNGDFSSHWQNLQFGRFCQNPQSHSSLVYPSPAMAPPVYLQGHFPWEGPGRPPSVNGNHFTQLPSYGPRLIPVAPLQPSSNRPNDLYRLHGDEVPRYRAGTGTYLPNHKGLFKDRHPSSIRNHKGYYNHDRSDVHNENQGNWNISSRQRASGRNYSRSQPDRPSSGPDRLTTNDNRADRPWDPYRNDSLSSCQSQNGPLCLPDTVESSSANMAYNMYPLMSVNSSNVASTGPSVPSVVMLYSYNHSGGYGLPAEKLEFGSLGPVHCSGGAEVSQMGEESPARVVYEQRRFQGGSPSNSSPDQPSSPQFQRSAAHRNYKLREQEFQPVGSKSRR